MDWPPILASMETAGLSIFIIFFLRAFAVWAVVSTKDEARRLFRDGVLTLPLMLPPTVAGLFLSCILGAKWPIRQLLIEYFSIKIILSWVTIAIAAVVTSFPLIYRSARGAFEQVGQNLVAAARVLGMSEQGTFWKILIVNAVPGVISDDVLASVRGLGEFSATAMIAGDIAGRTGTLSTAVYSEAAAGNMDVAYRYVAIIMVITFISVMLINWTALRTGSGRAQDMIVSPEYDLRLGVNIEKELKEFSLNMESEAGKECLKILGPSGCGKSMALRSIARIVRPDSGRIAIQYVQDEAAGGGVFYGSPLKVNRKPQVRHVGYLFQSCVLFPNMTVKQNIVAELNTTGGRLLEARERQPLTASEKGDKAREMVSQFHLERLEGRYPPQLSDGQQQCVALARILAYESKVLLLDEPFPAIDTYLGEGLRFELTRAVLDCDGVTVMATHDRDEAYQLCDNLLLLNWGRVLSGGRTRDILQEPVTCQAARPAGCKNISRIEYLGNRCIKALDWGGLELTTDRKVDGVIMAVGIKAHDLEPLSNGEVDTWKQAQDGNLIRVGTPSISEMLFEWYVTPDNGLWWKKERGIHTHNMVGLVPV